MSRALALAGCGVLSVGVAACESTEQESARIGRENAAAKLAAEAAHHTHRSRATTHSPAPAAGAHGAAGHNTTDAKRTSAP